MREKFGTRVHFRARAARQNIMITSVTLPLSTPPFLVPPLIFAKIFWRILKIFEYDSKKTRISGSSYSTHYDL
eukprot:UN17895